MNDKKNFIALCLGRGAKVLVAIVCSWRLLKVLSIKWLMYSLGVCEEEKHPIWEVASSHMARRVLVGNLYKEVKDPNLIAKISGHVENSRAFSRYRDIDEEMAKEVILKLE